MQIQTRSPRDAGKMALAAVLATAFLTVVSRGEEGQGRTAVVKSEVPPSYRILERKKQSREERKKIEKERAARLKSAKTFLAEKQKEYDGVPWTQRHQIRSKAGNFEIHCNSTFKVANAYAALMELIRTKLADMFPSKIHRNFRAAVNIYANQDEFIAKDPMARAGGHGLGGYYNFITQSINTYHGTFGFTGTTFSVLCHEGTHYYQGLVLKNSQNVPIWFIEGLAVYFGDGSTFDPKTAKIEIGKIPRDRLAHIQEKMLAKKHTSIAELVGMTRGPRGFTASHYADAWALIYFLVNSGGDGKKLLTAYWGIGLERQLTKKDFLDLAAQYYGDIKTLEKEYVKYVLAMDMPSVGRVAGDYFLSDYFQFDFKAPGEEWAFFEDRDDKSLLVGLLLPGTSGEVRIYYDSNFYNAEPRSYFEAYLDAARRTFKEVAHEDVKVSGLEAHKVSYAGAPRKRRGYFPPPPGDVKGAGRFEGEAPKGKEGEPGKEKGEGQEKEKDQEKDPGDTGQEKDGSQDGKAKKPAGKPKEDRVVVEYRLIQVDGVITLYCSASPADLPRLAETFDQVGGNFTLTFTRRW